MCLAAYDECEAEEPEEETDVQEQVNKGKSGSWCLDHGGRSLAGQKQQLKLD